MQSHKLTPPASRSSDPVLAAFLEKRRLASEAAQAKAHAASVTLRVTLDANTYGIFAAAGIVHKCSPTQAVEILLRSTDTVCDWSNRGFQTFSME